MGLACQREKARAHAALSARGWAAGGGPCGAGRAGRNWASRGVWGPGLSAGEQACWAGRGEKKRAGRG